MILPLSAQVANLELSKRLAALGMPQETWLKWVLKDDDPDCVYPHPAALGPAWGGRGVSAPTVAELGEMLRVWLVQPTPASADRSTWTRFDMDGGVVTGARDITNGHGMNEADARASLLIALCERGVVRWG